MYVQEVYSHWVKLDIGGDIVKYILTTANHLIWQMSQLENFAVCCVL